MILLLWHHVDTYFYRVTSGGVIINTQILLVAAYRVPALCMWVVYLWLWLFSNIRKRLFPSSAAFSRGCRISVTSGHIPVPTPAKEKFFTRWNTAELWHKKAAANKEWVSWENGLARPPLRLNNLLDCAQSFLHVNTCIYYQLDLIVYRFISDLTSERKSRLLVFAERVHASLASNYRYWRRCSDFWFDHEITSEDQRIFSSIMEDQVGPIE